jgi:hypothetical protein
LYYIDPATQKNGENSSNKELTIGKLPSKMLDGKMRFEVNIGQKMINNEFRRCSFSVLRYFAADIQNAYGPNVHDPRTGEILESHIGWYQHYEPFKKLVLNSNCCRPSRKNQEFDDKLMGELIRFVSSHEVGHTLGLRHNMGASSATPVEIERQGVSRKKRTYFFYGLCTFQLCCSQKMG